MPGDLLQALRESVLIGDGAYGTTLRSRRLLPDDTPGPALCLMQPSVVSSLHREYADAGANLIKTNTFQAHRVGLGRFNLAHLVQEMNSAATRLARTAAGDRAWVLGTIGPIGYLAKDLSDHELLETYREQATSLMEGGVDGFLLETFSDLSDLELAVRAVRSVDESHPVVAQMAFSIAGVTARGVSPTRAVERLAALQVDVIGANCGGGEASAVRFAREATTHTELPVSVYPNRGLASLDEAGEPQYLSGSEYFAKVGVQLAELGANIVGGCCGTTPDDIRALASAIGTRAPAKRARVSVAVVEEAAPTVTSAGGTRFQQTAITELDRDGICVLTEVDAPKGLNWRRQVEGIQELMASGVDSITVGDNPLSVVRMENLAFASLIVQQTGANLTLHLACRDRNTIGNQSWLLGASALGLRNVLVITGDPVATDAYPGSKGVFNSASVPLMRMIAQMNRGELSLGGRDALKTDFCIGGAFNSAARSLEAEVKKATRKVEAGCKYFLTQPVFELERALEIVAALEPLGAKVFVGIMPLLSERNADFLHNEVPGIFVPETVRQRMAGKKGEAGRAAGMDIAHELIEGFAARTRGVYLISQMDRYGMTADLARYAKSLARTGV